MKKKEYLQYELVANALNHKAGEAGFGLRVVKQVILSERQVIDQMHALMPDVPRELIVRMRACEDAVFVNNARAGRGISLPIVTMTHSIHGPRRGADGALNRATDSIRANMQAGKAVAEAAEEAAAYKVEANYAGPVIVGVTDKTLNETNGRITRGGYIRITGTRLELTGPRAAVLFEPADGSPAVTAEAPVPSSASSAVRYGSRAVKAEAPVPSSASSAVRYGSRAVKADLSKVLVNKPSELLVLVPDDVPLGPCLITVITHYTPSGGKVLTTPHIETFNTLLTVV